MLLGKKLFTMKRDNQKYVFSFYIVYQVYLTTRYVLSVIVHQNYVGVDGDKVPFFLSVVLSDANNQCVAQYRAILWRKTVSQSVYSSRVTSDFVHVKLLTSSVILLVFYLTKNLSYQNFIIPNTCRPISLRNG